MTAYLFDAAIILILLFFVLRGARKGLVLTLFGLAGLFIAFFGARLLSSALYQPVSGLIQPGIYETVTGLGRSDPDPAVTAEPSPSPESGGDTPEGELPGETAALSLDDLLRQVKSADLYKGLTDLLEDAVQTDKIRETAGNAALSLSEYLADLVAKAALFAAGFLVVLLLWTLLGRLLDLACRLPVLSAANRAGGAVLGLVKGALVVLLLVWLGQLAGLVPRQPSTPVLSLFSGGNLIRLLNGLVE